MADKAPHRDKRTIYGRQSTTQGQKNNLWQTKNHIGTKGQYMADKAFLLSLCAGLSAINCPFVPVWCFVGHRLPFCPCVVLCQQYIVLLSLCGALLATDCPFVQHHIGTKGQAMADKEPHRDKRTIYCRQSTTQGQKDNIWPTKQQTGTKGQYMAEKAPHISAIFCPCVLFCRP
jgi:hypothetical protein